MQPQTTDVSVCMILFAVAVVIATAWFGCCWLKKAACERKKRVIIIGGGFAGLAAARRLRRQFEVVLIDAKQYFEYAPGLHQPYASPSEHEQLFLVYDQICRKMAISWVWGRVIRLEHRAVHVRRHPTSCDKSPSTSENQDELHEELTYDFCVVAAGCQYGIELDIPRRATPTCECLWYPTLDKSPSGFDETTLQGRRDHIEHEHEIIKELNKRQAQVAVIGAGFVGVEFATELRHFFPDLHICIVEARSECCSSLCESAKQYIQKCLDKKRIACVYDVSYKEMMPPNDEDVFWQKLGVQKPDRVFISVGLRPQNHFLASEFHSKGRRAGWIKVNENLQIILDNSDAELAFDGCVFAVGNCIEQVPGVGFLPKNVFPAEDMAALACKNIIRLETAKPLVRFHWPWFAGLSATSLGPSDGICVVNNRLPGSGCVCLKGRLVAWQKELIRWTKIDECRLGFIGSFIWSIVH